MSNLETYTSEQLNLIKSVVARNATDAELQLFLYRCKTMKLDPLKPGHIHFVKYNSNSPGTIVVGIDGFRAKAAETGKHSGTKRGIIRDDKGKCIGAWCEIYRSDWRECVREEVSLSEYNTGKGPWSKMPETMIKKVAEAAALRMAFPDDIGGLYTKEEMNQAEEEIEVKELPKIVDLSEWVVPIGKKHIGKKLKDIPAQELKASIDWINSVADPNYKNSHDVKMFMFNVTEYLNQVPKSDWLSEPTEWD